LDHIAGFCKFYTLLVH